MAKTSELQKQDTSPRLLINLLIDRSFQGKLLSYFIVLFIISTITLYSTTFLFFWRLKEKGLQVGIPEGHVFYRFLSNQKYDLDLLFIGLAGVNFLLLIGVGFLISHRIAGPIYKLKKYIENLSTESEEFRLRQTDFFRDLEKPLNKLKEKLK